MSAESFACIKCCITIKYTCTQKTTQDIQLFNISKLFYKQSKIIMLFCDKHFLHHKIKIFFFYCIIVNITKIYKQNEDIMRQNEDIMKRNWGIMKQNGVIMRQNEDIMKKWRHYWNKMETWDKIEMLLKQKEF